MESFPKDQLTVRMECATLHWDITSKRSFLIAALWILNSGAAALVVDQKES